METDGAPSCKDDALDSLKNDEDSHRLALLECTIIGVIAWALVLNS